MRMSLSDYHELLKEKKPSKMRNIRTRVDGISFDSQLEANRYCELKMLMRTGEVHVFVRQPRFLLQEGFEKDGEWIGKLEYVADFLVVYADGRTVIEDTKGRLTRTYIDKRKLFEKKYPQLTIKEVNYLGR